MFHGLTSQRLAERLMAVPALKLLGLGLLAKPTVETFFPTEMDSESLVEATVELIAYNRACHAACHRIMSLPPTVADIHDEAFSL